MSKSVIHMPNMWATSYLTSYGPIKDPKKIPKLQKSYICGQQSRIQNVGHKISAKYNTSKIPGPHDTGLGYAMMWSTIWIYQLWAIKASQVMYRSL